MSSIVRSGPSALSLRCNFHAAIAWTWRAFSPVTGFCSSRQQVTSDAKESETTHSPKHGVREDLALVIVGQVLQARLFAL